MFQQRYYVDKGSDRVAGAELAHGLTALFVAWADANDEDLIVTLSDQHSHYALDLSDPVQEQWLAQGPGGLLRFLAAGKQFGPMKYRYVDGYDYEVERERRSAYDELRKQMQAAKGKSADPEWRDALRNAEPDPEHDFYAKINQMAAINSYNSLVMQWEALQPHIAAQLRLILELFSVSPNPVEAVAAKWVAQAKAEGWGGKARSPALQVVNPSMGKGANRTKADGNIVPNGLEVFWLLEYLKYVGARHAMLPRVVARSKDRKGRVAGAKKLQDRKSYLIEPQTISSDRLQTLFREYQKQMWASSHVKMDIRAVLRWMDVFLRDQVQAFRQAGASAQPADVVRGLWVTSYKALGSALVVINVSLLNIPRWMRHVESEADAARYFELVEEQRRVVESLDEKQRDGYELLRLYRDFLSGGMLQPFFHFCAGYGSHLLQRIERRQFAPQFSLPHLEELFMAREEAATKLKPILDNPGFQNVATAIRLSTVAPQYRKAKTDERVYEIRYDLGGRLMQKSRYDAEFVQELSEFMFRYNQENARVAEQKRSGPRRRDLTREDILELIGLVDLYHAPTVAGLLVAFGYARDPKAKGKGEPSGPTSDSGKELMDGVGDDTMIDDE